MLETTESRSIIARYWSLWIQVLITLIAVGCGEGVALLVSALLPVAWWIHLLVVIPTALLSSLLVSAWVNRHLTYRLERLLSISRAWLHGTLSLRLTDRNYDELGVLAQQLDRLVEQLEHDEQDLVRLREYSTRLSDQVRALAVDEERERLARELHDGVKQHLFSLSMTASALRARLGEQPGEIQEVDEMAREVEGTARTVQRSLTRLIENLRPVPLQEKGLAAALNDYTLLFGAREHILVYLDVKGNDALLAPSVAEALYRVAQEALHNVARHARATRVDVRLRCLPEQAILTLRDNGVGFDMTQAHRGLGLSSMQERIMAIGGRLQIESQVGDGTRIRAEVGLTSPLDLQAEVIGPDRGQPNPTIENWAWLGQRLVIPVGQAWPWLPADQIHLRRPLVEAGSEPVVVQKERHLGGLMTSYVVRQGESRVRVWPRRWGYAWKMDDAMWELRHVRGPSGSLRQVLTRNEQPLAAIQRQGRLMNTWSEIIYDGRGYSLSRAESWARAEAGLPISAVERVLADQSGEPLLRIRGYDLLRIELCRTVPLALLLTVALRVVEEQSVSTRSVEMLPERDRQDVELESHL